MFKKKKDKSNPDYLLSSFERMHHVIVKDSSQLYPLCDILLSGRALLTSFEQIDVEEANEMIYFISGVVYALKGEIHNLGEKTILFASEEEFKDGTLDQYIKERTE